ncbi:hypothetical protein L195_g059429, partial [Trifolium pratense]
DDDQPTVQQLLTEPALQQWQPPRYDTAEATGWGGA